jgi:circadian clock protein KaiC
MEWTYATTGIDGLNKVLKGGLLRNRVYLVRGPSGAGKTTLELQFLMEGIRCGEKALYIGTSETREEIEEVARAHGWDLSGLAIHHRKIGGLGSSDLSQTILHSSELDLPRTMESILSLVERIQPNRLVLDSLTEMRTLAQETHWFRIQLTSLKEFFAGRQCTVLLSDGLTGNQSVIESIVSGLLELESVRVDYGPDKRRLRVVKMRGQSYSPGAHDYRIERGGIRLFPRLTAAEYRGDSTVKTVPSGLPGLDRMLGGGLDRGTSILLLGIAGSGKSALAVRLAAAAAERGERSALFVFDERVQTFLHRSEGLGITLSRYVEQELIHIRQVDPAELTPGEFGHDLERLVAEQGVSFVVIDSLNGYIYAMPEERFLPVHLHELSSFLNQKAVTSLFISALQGSVGGVRKSFELSYIADTVLLFEPFQYADEIRKSIRVAKRRTGGHERTARELIISPNGVSIGQVIRRMKPVDSLMTEDLLELRGLRDVQEGQSDEPER